MTEKSNTRTQIIVAILGGIFLLIAAIISSPHWFKYFFPEQYIEQEAAPSQKTEDKTIEKNKSENTGTENLVINKLELCPINSKLPAYFFIEIKNKGSKKLKNISLEIDFGRASIIGVDLTGNNSIEKQDTTKSNELFVLYSELVENETKSIYCLLSQPVFSSIKINGENLMYSKEYTYKNFIESDGVEKSKLSGFFVFLLLIFGFILFVFALFFISMVYRGLKKKGLIDWD